MKWHMGLYTGTLKVADVGKDPFADFAEHELTKGKVCFGLSDILTLGHRKKKQ